MHRALELLEQPERLLSCADDEKTALTCGMLVAEAVTRLAQTEGGALRSRMAWPAPGHSSSMRQHREVTYFLTCPAQVRSAVLLVSTCKA